MMLNHTLRYAAASAVSACVGLLTATVLTRLLAPDQYGVYVIGLSTAGIVSAVLFTWVRVSAFRFQSDGESADVRATVLLAYGLSVLCAPLAVIATMYGSHVALPRAAAAVAFALGLGIFELGQELLKAKLRSSVFMAASVFRSLAAFGLGLAAALYGGGGIALLLAAAGAYFATALVFSGTIFRRPLAPINGAELKTFFHFGVNLTIGGFVFAIHAALDRLMVYHQMGDFAAGQYGASADLVRQIILIPAASIAAAIFPLTIRGLAAGGAAAARAQLETGFEILLAILLPAVVGLAFATPYVAAIVLGEQFRATAAAIMPILAFAWLFQSLSQSYVHISFYIAKKPKLILLQAVGTLLVNVAVMPPAIASFGLRGAAGALVLTEGLGLLLGCYLTRRAHPLPFVPRAIVKIGAATLAMACYLMLVRAHLGTGPLALGLVVAGGGLVYGLAAVLLDIGQVRQYLAASLARYRLAG